MSPDYSNSGIEIPVLARDAQQAGGIETSCPEGGQAAAEREELRLRHVDAAFARQARVEFLDGAGLSMFAARGKFDQPCLVVGAARTARAACGHARAGAVVVDQRLGRAPWGEPPINISSRSTSALAPVVRPPIYRASSSSEISCVVKFIGIGRLEGQRADRALAYEGEPVERRELREIAPGAAIRAVHQPEAPAVGQCVGDEAGQTREEARPVRIAFLAQAQVQRREFKLRRARRSRLPRTPAKVRYRG